MMNNRKGRKQAAKLRKREQRIAQSFKAMATADRNRAWKNRRWVEMANKFA